MQDSETDCTNTKYRGIVKWFNNKTGYGFIKCIDNDDEIFVHHKNVVVGNDQYKYLVQGEYVSFELELTQSKEDKHKYQAVNVRGIDGGCLMCETRQQFMNERRNQFKQSQTRLPAEQVLHGKKKITANISTIVPVSKRDSERVDINQEQAWRVVKKKPTNNKRNPHSRT